MKIGGIYIDKSWTEEEIKNNKVTEFGLHLGREQIAWFSDGEEIWDLHQDVEMGGAHLLKEDSRCTFGINKIKKEWHIKDNTKIGDDNILIKGKYHDDKVEKQVSSFISNMTGIK